MSDSVNPISHSILKIGKGSYCHVENPDYEFEIGTVGCSGFCFVGFGGRMEVTTGKDIFSEGQVEQRTGFL